MKDLVDMLLLLQPGTMDQARLTANIKATFRRRRTHDLPRLLPPPPSSWGPPFADMAAECGLDDNLAEQHRRLAAYLAAIQP